MNARDTLLTTQQARLQYEIESLTARVSDLIEIAISQSGLSKQEVAEACDVSPGRISQLISGTENLTLKAIAEVLFALGKTISIDLENADPIPVDYESSYNWTMGTPSNPVVDTNAFDMPVAA